MSNIKFLIMQNKTKLFKLVKLLISAKKDIINLTKQPNKSTEFLMREILEEINLDLNKQEFDEMLIYMGRKQLN